MPDPNSRELLDQLRAGNNEAATAIFDRYVERLLALARTRIGKNLRRRVDPEDVVQSAYRSFFVRANNGAYQLERSGDLWRLLASTTLNKLYGQVEKQTAAKRAMNRELAEEDVLAHLAAREPSVVEVIAVAEQLTQIVLHLSADERAVLLATLQGQEAVKIAKSIGKSTRTVRRLVAQAKAKFEKQLLTSSANSRKRQSKSQRRVEPFAPLKFADYQLQELLGSGGMGKVYRAVEKRSGKMVAVKSLHKSRQLDDRAVAQFVQEAQILAKLNHPNIVRVEGLGRFPAGGYFMVLDYVEGSDLQSRLKSARLAPKEAISICRDVAMAMQYAHDYEIVHCDLKPANVLLRKDGHVLVTDFGFAHFLSQPSATNQAVGGTSGYIAPEVLNLTGNPSPAADIYALGALLWTVVNGAVPMSLTDLHSVDPLTRPIEDLCRRCMAPEPANRFASASDVVRALAAIRKEYS